MTDIAYRHHRAHAGGPETRIVFVEVPVAGVDFGRQAKPPAYKRNQPGHWQPRTKPPTKAERTIRFLDAITRQEAEVRAWMDSLRRGDHRHAG
jgi:hypothetical protein